MAVQEPRFLMPVDEPFKSNKICVRRSPVHRWGVFALEPIKKSELLEESPYIAISFEEVGNAPSCEPYTYWLEDDYSLIGMGYAGLYNHSSTSNVDYQVDKVSEVIRHYATTDIETGEELLLNYGKDNAKSIENLK